MPLSKSDYLLYLRHPAWLWLKKHDPSKLPPIDDSAQARFDAGYLFESYANKLFPDAKLQHKVEHGQLTAICDVLEFIDDRTVDLTEIKSSTKVKPEHLRDLAFQVTVLQRCGYEVSSVSVAHVNNTYVRDGDVDPNEMVTITEVTDEVLAHLPETAEHIELALQVAASPACPDISPAHCKLGCFKDWLPIYKTLAPQEDGCIYDLCRLNPGQIAKFEKLGVTRMADIPADFKLHPNQKLQLEAFRLGQPIIEKKHIRDFLDTCAFPLYFFDYETLSGVVPSFDGLKPYAQLPFQYSLHILDSPDAELRHAGYLHRDNSNPAAALSAALQSHLGPEGTIITWNMSFEKGCNSLIGSLLSDYAGFYDDMNLRIVDLMLPFSRGWYAHKDFRGSASIKNVLPVLVPELSHQNLGISDGGSAQRLWMQAILDSKHPADRAQILSDLDAYCALDTLAMVEIYRHLLTISTTDPLLPETTPVTAVA